MLWILVKQCGRHSDVKTHGIPKFSNLRGVETELSENSRICGVVIDRIILRFKKSYVVHTNTIVVS